VTAWIGYYRAMFNDGAAWGILARAPLLGKGEKSSCLAEAGCKGGGFVG
jgi:hypothetical protein